MVVCRQVAGDDEQQLAGALPSRFGVRSISSDFTYSAACSRHFRSER